MCIEQKISNHVIQFVATLEEKEQLVTKIPIYQSDKVMFVETNDVACIVAESGGYCEIFTTSNQKFVVTKNLLNFENLLQNETRFVRASKSVLLNTNDIRSYDRGGTGYIEMKTNGYEIFVSRRKKKEILDLIG